MCIWSPSRFQEGEDRIKEEGIWGKKFEGEGI